MSQVRVLPGALALRLAYPLAVLGFLAGVMFFVAAVLVYFSVGALSNLWADQRDSAAATYIAVGGLDLLGAAAATAVGAWLMRGHGRRSG